VDPAEFLTDVPGGASRARYQAGTVLVSQGETASHVILVQSGLLKLVHRWADGQAVVLGLCGEGSCVGVADAIVGMPLRTTIIAVTDCDVWEIGVPAFLETLRREPRAAWSLLVEQSRELYRRVDDVARLVRLPARRRVELVLVQLAVMTGAEVDDGSFRVRVPLPQREVAEASHVTRETLSRVLATLEREGGITRRQNRITSISKELLQRIGDSDDLSSGNGIRPRIEAGRRPASSNGAAIGGRWLQALSAARGPVGTTAVGGDDEGSARMFAA
jgi:CRP-like cAMP-binding protein